MPVRGKLLLKGGIQVKSTGVGRVSKKKNKKKAEDDIGGDDDVQKDSRETRLERKNLLPRNIIPSIHRAI